MTSRSPLEPGSPTDLIDCADELMAAWKNHGDARVLWAIGDPHTALPTDQLWMGVESSWREIERAYGRLRAAISAAAQPSLFS